MKIEVQVPKNGCIETDHFGPYPISDEGMKYGLIVISDTDGGFPYYNPADAAEISEFFRHPEYKGEPFRISELHIRNVDGNYLSLTGMEIYPIAGDQPK